MLKTPLITNISGVFLFIILALDKKKPDLLADPAGSSKFAQEIADNPVLNFFPWYPY
jgi:hypothetical protein